MKPIRLSIFAFVFAVAVFTNAYAGQKSAPCATLTLQAAPATVPPGGVETLSGTIASCSQGTQRFSINYEIEGPCNYYDSYTVGVTLRPGETQVASISRTAPSCLGTYTITGTVTANGVYVTSTSTSFTVQ